MISGPAVVFAGDEMRVHFDRFDIAAYSRFLRCKTLPESRTEFHEEDDTYTIVAPARFASFLGIQDTRTAAGELKLADHLFDDQRFVTTTALAAKRFACWSDCGWGKTLLGLEWARLVIQLTGGRVLIFTRNEIIQQWVDEAAKWYGEDLPVQVLHSRQEMKEWAQTGQPTGALIGITNYEKLNYSREGPAGQVVREFQGLAGVILDEGSRLRTQAGKQKWALIKSCENIEYKLILTATPAPNDLAEFMSQAGFLNKFRAEESINTYFRRDDKTHRWTVRPHARAAFFRWMASWSIYIRDPRKYGWRLGPGFVQVPEPTVIRHDIKPTFEQMSMMRLVAAGTNGRIGMFPVNDLNTIQRMKLSQLAKGFLYVKTDGKKTVELVPSLKPGFVANLIRSEVAAGRPTLVWTTFDAEADLLAFELRHPPGAVIEFDLLNGKTPKRQRQEILDRFRFGESRCLISLASMLGFGMNLQHAKSMIFSGWNDSYESFYQAVRRAYRHGQSDRLRIHLPVIPELEGEMLNTIMRKQTEHAAAIEEMESNYVRVLGRADARRAA